MLWLLEPTCRLLLVYFYTSFLVPGPPWFWNCLYVWMEHTVLTLAADFRSVRFSGSAMCIRHRCLLRRARHRRALSDTVTVYNYLHVEHSLPVFVLLIHISQ